MTTYRDFCIKSINSIDERIQKSELTNFDSYQIGRYLSFLETTLRNKKDLDVEMNRGEAFYGDQYDNK